MGATECCEVKPIFEAADYINMVAIAVNILLTYWIVNVIQGKINNKRVLKDHYINEFKLLRDEYENYLNQLLKTEISPKNIIPWFKLMNIKVTDLMKEINCTYKINGELLKPYQNDLRELVTENKDFINQFNNELLELSVSSKNSLIKFKQKNNKLFNQIVVQINNK